MDLTPDEQPVVRRAVAAYHEMKKGHKGMVKLRGYLAVSLAAVFLLAGDPIQRFVICPATRMFPSAGPHMLGAWQRFLARGVFFILGWIGGAALPAAPRIPGEAGVLILMNHQSFLDIPLMIASLDGSYPRIVTRSRYARWIPLISHTLRKFAYPLVDPEAKAGTGRRNLHDLAEAARTSAVPAGTVSRGQTHQERQDQSLQDRRPGEDSGGAGLERIRSRL